MEIGANLAVIGLALWCLIGVAMTAVRLPGTWVIVVSFIFLRICSASSQGLIA